MDTLMIEKVQHVNIEVG